MHTKRGQMRVAVDAVICELVSATTFLVIREIYREILKFQRLDSISNSDWHHFSNACRRGSLNYGTGNIFSVTGNAFGQTGQKQGIFVIRLVRHY